MAKMEVNGIDEVMKAITRMAEPTKMAIKAVDSAAPVLEECFKSAVRSSADRGYATGELENSIARTPAKENALGVYSVVRAKGSDSKGMRYAEELAYLEYGVKKKKGRKAQAPRPVRQKAINLAQSKCEKILEDEISKAVDAIW